MKKVHKAVIEAAEAYYLDSNETDRHNDLMSAVEAMREARAVQADVLGRTVTEEPPVGSRVKDRDGDIWTRRESGWHVEEAHYPNSWEHMRDWGPLKLLPSGR